MTLPDSSPQRAREELRAELRAELRHARRSIPPAERARCARRVALIAERSGLLPPAQRIGLYLALPEELETTALLARARRRGCRIYLPRIDAAPESRSMQFVSAAGRARRNRFGIREPSGAALPSARMLDVLFVPLVGFDRSGNRLGMGGGYYDRALAFTRSHALAQRPLLVGLAYARQELDHLQCTAHDVPLDIVITERGLIRCGCMRARR